MIVGYWNTQYGDHFFGRIEHSQKAYHGPPVVDQARLKDILSHNSVSEICQYLKQSVLSDVDFKSFNRQAAWSNDELSALVCDYGFESLCFSKP